MRVLDVACGNGRHAIGAAQRGAAVVGVDADEAKLTVARRQAEEAGVTVEWVCADLTRAPLPPGPFDMVMVFNYLDRARMPELLQAVKPGGYLLMETFLEQQRELGPGPSSDDHLLKSGELLFLVEPFQIVLAREVLEVLDGDSRAVASVLAERPTE